MKKLLLIVISSFLLNCAESRQIIKGQKEIFGLKLQYLETFGPSISGYGLLNKISRIKINDKKLYIADSIANKIIIINYSGVYYTSFGGYGISQGYFDNLISFSFDSAGLLYTLEKNNSRIQKFNSYKNVVRTFGTKGRGREQMFDPEDIAINMYGEIFICDTGNDLIKHFDAFGNLKGLFGYFGTGKGFFNKPEQIAIDNKNNIYVLDRGNKRLQKFNNSYNYLLEIKGIKDILFKSPDSLCIEKNNRIFIGDSKLKKIFVFSEAGDYIINYDVTFDIKEITSIAVNGAYLFLADGKENKIYKFKFTNVSK